MTAAPQSFEIVRIVFAPDIWFVIQMLLNARGDKHEFTFFGIPKDPENPTYITDIFIPKQQVASAHTRLDEASRQEFFDKHPASSCPVLLWFHTHPNMSASPSGDDIDTFNHLTNNSRPVVMGILARNDSREFKAQIRVPIYDGKFPGVSPPMYIAKDIPVCENRDMDHPFYKEGKVPNLAEWLALLDSRVSPLTYERPALYGGYSGPANYGPVVNSRYSRSEKDLPDSAIESIVRDLFTSHPDRPAWRRAAYAYNQLSIGDELKADRLLREVCAHYFKDPISGWDFTPKPSSLLFRSTNPHLRDNKSKRETAAKTIERDHPLLTITETPKPSASEQPTLQLEGTSNSGDFEPLKPEETPTPDFSDLDYDGTPCSTMCGRTIYYKAELPDLTDDHLLTLSEEIANGECVLFDRQKIITAPGSYHYKSFYINLAGKSAIDVLQIIQAMIESEMESEVQKAIDNDFREAFPPTNAPDPTSWWNQD